MIDQTTRHYKPERRSVIANLRRGKETEVSGGSRRNVIKVYSKNVEEEEGEKK